MTQHFVAQQHNISLQHPYATLKVARGCCVLRKCNISKWYRCRA